MRGDEWKRQAVNMVGKDIVSIDCKGCMAHVEEVIYSGTVKRIEPRPDAASPSSSVIWKAICEGDNGSFEVIVARCTWSDINGRWEERI